MTALFRDNYIQTLKLLDNEQRLEIKNSETEYIVLDVQCTNNSAWVVVTLTNNYEEFEQDFIDGNCTLFDRNSWNDLIENYEYKTEELFYPEEV